MVPRRIILSPHPDDAVWSLGGAIPLWKNEGEVVILSVYDGDASAHATVRFRETQHRWRSFGSAAQRRVEEARAMSYLQCHYRGLGYCDAAMRLSAAGQFEYASQQSVLGRRADEDWPAVPDSLAKELQSLLRPQDTLVAPLAVGLHPDHCTVHKLARQFIGKIVYYAEFPYYKPGEPWQLSSHLGSVGLTLEETTLPCDWEHWLTAALSYRSQIVRLFRTRANFSDHLALYAQAAAGRGVCRIWSTR